MLTEVVNDNASLQHERRDLERFALAVGLKAASLREALMEGAMAF